VSWSLVWTRASVSDLCLEKRTGLAMCSSDSNSNAVIDELVARIRAGERTAAAEFIRRHEAQLRRRYRHKMGASLRRLVDSDDIVSTLSRRLDAYIASGKLHEVTLEQLWRLISRMVENALADKGRLVRRLKNVESEDRGLATALVARVDAPEELDLRELIGTLQSPVDREIVVLWLGGSELKSIADELGLSEDGVRKRWERTKAELRQRLESA
jgi:DNA-directed RNA polymerase specialized sigma24 family protein